MNSYYCKIGVISYMVNEIIDYLLLLILMILVYLQIVNNVEMPPDL